MLDVADVSGTSRLQSTSCMAFNLFSNIKHLLKTSNLKKKTFSTLDGI